MSFACFPAELADYSSWCFFFRCCDSHVKAIKPYGAFVEIRGMSGLLHISQISFDRIEDLPSIMQMGMKLKCMIIDHDKVRHSLNVISVHSMMQT